MMPLYECSIAAVQNTPDLRDRIDALHRSRPLTHSSHLGAGVGFNQSLTATVHCTSIKDIKQAAEVAADAVAAHERKRRWQLPHSILRRVDGVQ